MGQASIQDTGSSELVSLAMRNCTACHIFPKCVVWKGGTSAGLTLSFGIESTAALVGTRIVR